MNNQPQQLIFPNYTPSLPTCNVLYKWEILDGATIIYTQTGIKDEALNQTAYGLGFNGNLSIIDVSSLAIDKVYTFNQYVIDSCVGAAPVLVGSGTFQNIEKCIQEPEPITPFCQKVKECETLTILEQPALAGTSLALKYTGEDGVLQTRTIDLAPILAGFDSDTRLTNPHFGAGAGVGFNRLFFDLYNVVSGLTVAANYTYIDVPVTFISADANNTLTVGTDGGLYNAPFLETVTSITNTVIGHKIADYTNEAGVVTAINETVTGVSLVLNPLTNILTLTHNNELGVPLSTDIDLSALAIDINVASMTYNPVTGELILTETDGTVHTITIAPAAFNVSCGLIGTGTLADPYRIAPTIATSANIGDVTGNILTTDPSQEVTEAYTVWDGCRLRVFNGKPLTSAQYYENELALITDLGNADFVEIALENLPSSQDVNSWFSSLLGTKPGQQITIHLQGAPNGNVINYNRETNGALGTASYSYNISVVGDFYSFTVIRPLDKFGIKLN